MPETMRADRSYGPGEALVRVRAAGAIRATIDRAVPLEDMNRVLDDLRQGKVVGRAVVTP